VTKGNKLEKPRLIKYLNIHGRDACSHHADGAQVLYHVRKKFSGGARPEEEIGPWSDI
jgi:hypothetical protein